MNKVLCIFIALLCLLALVSCASADSTDSSSNSALNYSSIEAGKNELDFNQVYRGFTCLGDTDMSGDALLSGNALICSENDFVKFCNKYCSTATSMSVDFDRECLIAVASLYGSRSNESSSFEITAVKVADGKILDVELDTSSPVYVINSNGHGHLFVNIVSVDRSQIDVDKNGDCLRWAD